MPARGNEKPHAETRVRVLQRQWATPVPQVGDLDALNRYLWQCCLREWERTVDGYAETIGQRFERDRAAALGLPAHPFDACVVQAAQVDKYQTVRFDHNRYSVPRAYAYQGVTVKGYVERVEVVAGGQVVARHPRSYQREEQVLDPLHYLAALGRRPAALDHAPVLRHWQLPACFAQLRQALEQRHGPRAGVRQYIRVLQLLAEHPLERVQQAVAQCLPHPVLDADRIRARVTRLAEVGSASAPPIRDAPPECPSSVTPLCQYHVPRPDLGRFDQLLSQGEEDDDCERQHAPAAAEQPQTTTAAGHACRV
jgi:hypothetical protein